jgi:hypothetical protein
MGADPPRPEHRPSGRLEGELNISRPIFLFVASNRYPVDGFEEARMRTVLGVTIVAIGLLPALVAAQQPDPAVPSAPPIERGQLPTVELQATDPAAAPQKTPFSRLFMGPSAKAQPHPQGAREVTVRPNSTRVVCGMTVIQADPSVDPRIALQVPENGQRHAIRRIRPPVCTE